MKRLNYLVVLLSLAMGMSAQEITPTMLTTMRSNYASAPGQKAMRNAAGNTDLRSLALNQDNLSAMDTHFTFRVPNKGITDQQKSGRCWLFTGLNVLRANAIREHNLGEFTFSQSYLFFYDQLEKSNLFLQSIIDTRHKALDSQEVQWLLEHPISDGGTFTGVADLVSKYGLVPKDVMHETYSANNTSRFDGLLKLKLREFALQLREASSGHQVLKIRQLQTIYNMLCTVYGEPPTSFRWTRRDSKGTIVSTETYTPLQFAEKFGKPAFFQDYVMLMNDPSREYYKVYEIQLDRHLYDGHNWVYLNLPIEEIEQMATQSLRDTTAMYFSCDVAKELNSDRGLLDMNNYDYGSIFGTTFGMDKKHRVQSLASGSSHAMTLVAVDLDSTQMIRTPKSGLEMAKPVKWMVENSWGEKSGYKGHLIMTDEWFHEYMFRLVVEAKYLPEALKPLMKQKPIMLPCWDPMFGMEE